VSVNGLWRISLHVHSLLGNVFVSSREGSPLLGYATIDEAVSNVVRAEQR
jgi:hypothetical protein